MIRNLFLMLIVALTSLLGLTACGADSKPTPTVTVIETETVTATPTPNPMKINYMSRVTWGNSLERGALIKQISDASDEIYRAALLTQTEYDDTPGNEWTDTSGNIFNCSSRFWRPGSSEWTYVVYVCRDNNEQINSYASRAYQFDSVHIIGGERDNSVAVSNDDVYDVDYAHVSLDANSTCYSEGCGNVRGQVSTAEENKLIEMEAARLLTKAAQALPQG